MGPTGFHAAFKVRLNSIVCNGTVMLQVMYLCMTGDLCILQPTAFTAHEPSDDTSPASPATNSERMEGPPRHATGKANHCIDGTDLTSAPESKHGHSASKKPPKLMDPTGFPAAFKVMLNSIVCTGIVKLQPMYLSKAGDLCTWTQTYVCTCRRHQQPK